MSRRALDDVANGRASSVAAVAFQTTVNRRTIVASGSLQPAAWKGRDGRVWFATRGVGVVELDPARVTDLTVPAKTRFATAYELDPATGSGRRFVFETLAPIRRSRIASIIAARWGGRSSSGVTSSSSCCGS